MFPPVELKLDRGFAPEHGNRDVYPVLVRLKGRNDADKAGQRPVDDARTLSPTA